MSSMLETVEHFDALVIGGGPAGSTAARALRRGGLRVAVLDRAVFPRDKLCAGWITPPVLPLLELDIDHYRTSRTFQPITAFRTGLMGQREIETEYGSPVSFGILRCEFDEYLLQRAGAQLRCGQPVSTLRRRADGRWVVNELVSAPVIVGAGGHFCPIARWLNRQDPDPRQQGDTADGRSLVAAMEFEVPLNARQLAATEGHPPLLRFCADFSGYGWCFRKQQVLNVGIGRVNARELRQAALAFVRELVAEGVVPADIPTPLRGHAYLLANSARECVADGVLLAGDAAGLADPHSGEGIRPAIESGLLAARTILDADGHYDRARLDPYRRALRARFGGEAFRSGGPRLPAWFTRILANRVMASRWLTRHVVLDRWFLGRHRPSLN
jgi:flavin-dependent dehydrogenase